MEYCEWRRYVGKCVLLYIYMCVCATHTVRVYVYYLAPIHRIYIRCWVLRGALMDCLMHGTFGEVVYIVGSMIKWFVLWADSVGVVVSLVNARMVDGIRLGEGSVGWYYVMGHWEGAVVEWC